MKVKRLLSPNVAETVKSILNTTALLGKCSKEKKKETMCQSININKGYVPYASGPIYEIPKVK